MSSIFIILVGILVVLAISDLIVGVSNDAVNFLNSALGSKAFNFKVIMFIAALGIMFGATFSSGMMEVARKGIFHPEYFYFSEIMLLFLAVMITDVILLDLFNTFGMPTSTTVSIVFELLGAAVGLALIKVLNDPEHLPLNEYINSGKAMTIILGILLSVVIAFTSGAIIQYFSRLLFSFNYQKKIKYFGAIWGGIAITAITYFILVKGAKGASFMSDDMKTYIKDNAFLIIVITFVAWTIVLQLIQWLTKFDILKLIVLIGTFALAMAFAGNDLVNFIGVPLAGYEAYVLWAASGADASTFEMIGLAGKVSTPTVLLLAAGIIMALTLYFSKKAKSVTETEISLGRQEEGFERFGSSSLSRSLVRTFSKTGKLITSVIPSVISQRIGVQFDRTAYQTKQATLGKNAPAFDLLRASVILSVASIIISIATFLKLPLSTTYVTFMVAMGASLADGAWGRETAVYRITGVLSVIGGWFLTAFFAFSSAFIMVFLFYYGSYYAIFAMVLVAAFIVFRTHVFHKKKLAEKTLDEDEDEEDDVIVYSKSYIKKKNSKNINKIINEVKEIIRVSFLGLKEENLILLSKNYKKFNKLNSKSESLQNDINNIINKMSENDIEYGNYYSINLHYLSEIVQSLKRIAWNSFHHVDNNHSPLLEIQIEELENALKKAIIIFDSFLNRVNEQDMGKEDFTHSEMVDLINLSRKNQIKRIKKNRVGTKNSILFFSILDHLKSIINFTNRLQLLHEKYGKESLGENMKADS